MSGVGSWKYDILKDEFSGTQEMFQIYGIESRDFKGDFNSTLKLIHPEDQSKIQKAMERHLKGESSEFEFRILQPDGSVKHVLGRGEPIFDQNGQVISVLGTLQDISQNKILELELRKSYKILAQAQALASFGSWEMDLTDWRIYWSEEAYKIFGVTPEQLNNSYQKFLKLVHPEDVIKIETLLKNPSQKPCELGFRIIRPDGAVRNIFELVEFIFTEDGQPIFVYGTIQDVTEKIELERAVRRKQEKINLMKKRFEALVQKSTDVFEIIAPDGTIKYISDASEKVIGYKPEERIGKKIYEYYEGKELEKITGMVNFVLNESREIQSDIVFTTKKGSKVVLEVHMQNLLTEPAVEGIVVNFRDITKRVEMTRKYHIWQPMIN